MINFYDIYTLKFDECRFFVVNLTFYREEQIVTPVDSRRLHILQNLGIPVIKKKNYIPGDDSTNCSWILSSHFFNPDIYHQLLNFRD